MKENFIKTEVTRLTPTEKQLIESIRDYYQTSTKPEKEIVYETIKQPLLFEEGKSRVLVVGDLHCPFDLEIYLDHCKQVYYEFDCNKTVFIGDIIDNHYPSFHTSNPDGFGAGEELNRAKAHLKRWHQAFPEATVILGNHDRMVARKAFEGGIPAGWIKDYADVLETPNWNYTVFTFIDGVEYVHGEGATARTRLNQESHSIVQGHRHTEAYVDWVFSDSKRTFGIQVGTGIDFKSYAFAYAQAGKKPAVSCAVVLNGLHPFLIPMQL